MPLATTLDAGSPAPKRGDIVRSCIPHPNSSHPSRNEGKSATIPPCLCSSLSRRRWRWGRTGVPALSGARARNKPPYLLARGGPKSSSRSRWSSWFQRHAITRNPSRWRPIWAPAPGEGRASNIGVMDGTWEVPVRSLEVPPIRMWQLPGKDTILLY